MNREGGTRSGKNSSRAETKKRWKRRRMAQGAKKKTRNFSSTLGKKKMKNKEPLPAK